MTNTTSPSPLSRRTVLSGALGLAGIAGLAACGSGSGAVPGQAPAVSAGGGATGYAGPKVALQFWNGFTGGDGPFMKRLVDQFNSEHANIAVSMNTMQWADYYAKLPAAVTAGKGPEIGIMHVDSVATNAARNVIQPLDDVATALKLDESDFAPVPWKAGVYNGKRYSIPLDVHPARLLLQQDGHGEGRHRPREAADDGRRVHGGPRDDEGQGRRGALGEPRSPSPAACRSSRSSTSSAGRSSPTTPSRCSGPTTPASRRSRGSRTS